jgi:hydroxyquinol 1,2-dioxygenase
VHFLVTAPGFEPLITHLFEKGAPYLDSDVVFGTKQQLVVGYERHDGGTTPAGDDAGGPWAEAQFDFVLQPVGHPPG